MRPASLYATTTIVNVGTTSAERQGRGRSRARSDIEPGYRTYVYASRRNAAQKVSSAVDDETIYSAPERSCRSSGGGAPPSTVVASVSKSAPGVPLLPR